MRGHPARLGPQLHVRRIITDPTASALLFYYSNANNDKSENIDFYLQACYGGFLLIDQA